MKKHNWQNAILSPGLKLLMLCLLIFSETKAVAALPDQETILGKMILANTYFMNKWPDPTANIVTNKTRPSNLWTRGVYYEGLMQLYYLTKNTSYYNYAVQWGTFHKWQPTYTGFTPTRIADNQCCGQTYLELYQLDPQPERISTMKASIDLMLNSTKNNDWWWIDALQMAMPVFARFGVITGNDQYYTKMYELYNYTKNQAKGVGLYNAADSLWYRDSVYLPPKKSPNGLPVYWSRGNGWVIAALVRSLDLMPDNAPYRNEYIKTFRQMSAKLIRLQRPDGFWNVNLGDPDDYGGRETSGTVFFTYALAWGINQHLLDSAQYIPYVAKAWNGLVTDALHADGSLGYVQSSGSKPADGQPLSYTKMPDFEDFGLGGFLLAGSEVYRLVSGHLPTGNTQELPEKSILRRSNHGVYTLSLNRKYTKLLIYDSVGKLVMNVDTSGMDEYVFSACNVNNTGISKGLYCLYIQNNNEKTCFKIVL